MAEIPDECTCDWEFRCPGVLGGVRLMDDWVRMSTDAACPTHGGDDGG